MAPGPVLKKMSVLALVLLYCMTTPVLSTFHVHCAPHGGSQTAVSTLGFDPAKAHAAFCDVCFRITTASHSTVPGNSVVGQLHPLTYREFQGETFFSSHIPVHLPARAPPSSAS